MDSLLRGLAERSDDMAYHTANFTSEEHRSFPYVQLSSRRGACSRRREGASKVRVWIQGAVHGKELADDEVSQALLRRFDDNAEWAGSILNDLELIVRLALWPKRAVTLQYKVYEHNSNTPRDKSP